MKMQSLKLFIATLVVCFISVSSSFAQTSLEFEIPFDFHIGKTKMDAGKYQIRKTGDKRFVLKDLKNNRSMFVISTAQVGNEREVKTENIVFHRYGNTFFLREIYARRGTVGRELNETKAERKVRNEYLNENPRLAKNNRKTERVSINSTQ